MTNSLGNRNTWTQSPKWYENLYQKCINLHSISAINQQSTCLHLGHQYPFTEMSSVKYRISHGSEDLKYVKFSPLIPSGSLSFEILLVLSTPTHPFALYP